MSLQDNPLSQKLQSLNNISPQSKRNTKNLSLHLNKPKDRGDGNHNAPPPGFTLYRHPSMSSIHSPVASNRYQPNTGLKRRTTLSLSIPTDIEVGKQLSSGKSSSNSIPSFTSLSSTQLSSSPIISSPLIPSTPKDIYSQSTSSSHTSTQTIQTLTNGPQNHNPALNNDTNGDLKTQTLIHNLSNIQITPDGDYCKLNVYPEGPACVFPPSLFLYSEPELEQLSSFDLVINVAKELTPPIPHEPFSKDSIIRLPYDNLEYYFVPWTHTSKISKDLEFLTNKIMEFLSQPNKKILIHCQCGVSRSASLIVALFMKLDHTNLNDAYSKLKDTAPEINPNMSLIFQLMEWGEILGISNRDRSMCSMSPRYDSIGSPLNNENNENNENTEKRIQQSTPLPEAVLIHDYNYN